ncbi:MAG: endonuclease/exonuclease/phosphatase family protein [Aggregatilineales bacterium]
MLKRLRLQPETLMLLEATLIGLFFVQALRFAVGMAYSRVAGASIALALEAMDVTPIAQTAPDPAVVSNEITFLLSMLALPLITLLLGGLRPLIIVAALITAAGRWFMFGTAGLTPLAGAALVIGGGLMYIALLVRERAMLFPIMFVLAIAIDQLFRAVGNTLDPSWSSAYEPVQAALSIGVALLAVISFIWVERQPRPELPHPRYGLLPFWGGIGFGALLFLQLSLLALPNAIGGRARFDYTLLVPFVMLATLLPLAPAVRGRARVLIGVFDGSIRGWVWMLVLFLLIALGTRAEGIAAAIALVLAQFMATLVWWWLVRPRAEKDLQFGGLWLAGSALIFSMLVTADNFTYEYAYVRDLTGDFAFLNEFVPPLLRAFRGLGWAVLLLAAFLAVLPMTQVRRRIPWAGGSVKLSLLALLVTVGATLGAAYVSQPPQIVGVSNIETMRVGSYNIHSGADEFHVPSLDAIARTIQQSGANIVLLQEVDGGRLTSFGVDQSLWLARRLGMDRRFFPTNEGLFGLAVLSNIEIAFADGRLLQSLGQQTGLQRVQIQPNPGVVITLYNTWLEYLLDIGEGSLEAQQQEQQRQLNEIFAIIAAHHPTGVLGRTVIGGTFNNVPDSPLMMSLRDAGFTDPFAGLPLEISATLVRSGVPRARFDYLWLRNLTAAEGVLVLDSAASDHRMLVAGVLVSR